ncbi:hypothetical protein Tco_1030659 [Tanacetum coccineum]|uniref:Uncharacterized protein n=1 Tax=Tanacetum coccineum TaxID=301880 RepID=A0ABQ5G7Z5_9ASTR
MSAGKGPTWLFDLDYLTDSMNYQSVRSENQANKHAGPQEANHNAGTGDIKDAGNSKKEADSTQDYFVLPIWSSYSSTVKRSTAKDAGEAPNKHLNLKTDEKPVDKEDQVFLDELERLKGQTEANNAAEALRKEFAQETEELLLQAGAAKASSTNIVNTTSTPVSTASPYGGLSFTDLTNPDPDDSEIPALEDIYNNPTDGIFTNSSYDDEGAVADFTNLEPVMNVSPIPTSRINSIHPSTLILGDPQSAVQTRSKVTKSSGAHAFGRTAAIQISKRIMDTKDELLTRLFSSKKDKHLIGLVLWGDLKVLMDSPEVNDGSDVWKNQHTWSIQSWKLYSYSGVHVLETVSGLVVHMFVDKKYPLSVNLIERMLDHQLEICHETVGNELTTAVQLIAFLKKQISDSRRPKVHDCPRLDADCLVADSTHMKVAFGVGFKMIVVPSSVTTSRYVVPTGRVKVPAGRYVVPTGKDKFIVSAGRTKVIPAEEPVTIPHDSPLPRVQSLGSDEGSLSLNELMVLCTSLSNKVQSLENELKETKQTYNSALTKLIRRVKKLEQIIKASNSRRRARVVLTDDEGVSEDPSKQGRIIVD